MNYYIQSRNMFSSPDCVDLKSILRLTAQYASNSTGFRNAFRDLSLFSGMHSGFLAALFFVVASN